MNAIETAFRRLFAAGVTIQLDGELLRARPAPLITPEVAEIIRMHKPAIVACLMSSSNLGACPNCRGALVAIPTFDGFENIECIGCDTCNGCRKVTE